MKSLAFSLVALAALGLGLFFGLQQAGINPFASTPPATLSGISLEDVDGNMQNGDQWLGKVVLVNHWASWCPPCVKELPLLVDAQEQLGTRGLQVVGIAHDFPEAARTFGDQLGINYPSLVVEQGGAELMISQGSAQGSALPFTAVFNREGKLVEHRLGAIDGDDIAAMVEPLL